CDRAAARQATGLRVRVRDGPLRRRQQNRLLASDGRARARAPRIGRGIPVGSLRDRGPRAPNAPQLSCAPMAERGFSHLDPLGRAKLVDTAPKDATHRRALARCKVFMAADTTAMIANNAVTKGDVLAAARIAGIQAAKRTSELIPLCHPLLVGAVQINFNIGDDNVSVEAQVETV